MTRWIPWLTFSVCLASCVPATSVEKPAAIEREESWQVIEISGQRVGYARVLTDALIRENQQPLVQTTAETHMTIKRFGQTLRMATTLVSEETVDGDLQQFTFEMSNPPATTTKTVGNVDGEKLKLQTEINGKKETKSQKWTPGVKSPTYQDRMLRDNPLKPGESKKFAAFLPEFAKSATITVEAGDFETIALLEGQKSELQQIRVSNSLLPGIVTKAWVDRSGQSLKSSTNMLGTEMVTYTVSRDEALKTISVGELDLAVSTLVKTQAIPNPYQTKKVVYRVTVRGDQPLKVIPSGPLQQLKSIDDDTAELTVLAAPVPKGAKIEPTDAEFTEPTPYLQSNDELVAKHAAAAAGSLIDPGEISLAMEKYVREKLTQKNFSTALASAAEVAKSMAGDCTEHAVLLAAMLRAKGIPSRVAVGLVYIDGDHSFGGHMWTEARLGNQWIPLDGTLGRGGTGATHIKLGDSTFDEEGGAPLSSFASLISVIGQLTIDVVSAE